MAQLVKTVADNVIAHVKSVGDLDIASVKTIMGLDNTAGGAFDLLDLHPELWLDGSDVSTMYDAESGGSLVANNGTVWRWEDKSTHGNHAVHPYSTPQRIDNAQNTLAGIYRPNTDVSLRFPRPYRSETSVYFLVSKTSTSTGYITLFDGDTGGQYLDASQSGSGSGVNSGAGTPTYRVNGSLLTSPTRDTLLTARGTGAHILTMVNVNCASAECQIGGYSNFSAATQYIFEIIICPSSISSGDIDDVEAYLADKWDITI